MRTLFKPFLFAVVTAMTLTSCQTINLGEQEAAKSSPAQSATPAKAPSPFKPWAEVLKDTQAMKGQFNAHLKRDQTLFLEIQPGQMEMDFGLISHFSKGTGVFDLHDGLALGDTRVLRFRRVGDTIYLVHMNMLFTAEAGSPTENSLKDNVGNSIIGAFAIESRHDTTGALLINFTDFIVSDYKQLADRIRPYFANRPVQFVKASSYVEQVQVFPTNVEIDALLTYKPTGSPITTSAGVSDVSSVPVGLRYSFFALPETPMERRIADDRHRPSRSRSRVRSSSSPTDRGR